VKLTKLSVAFGLVATIATGTLTRCVQVVNNPQASGPVDRAILSFVPSNQYPSSMENESGFTRAIYSSLTNGTKNSKKIRDNYARDYLPITDVTLAQEDYRPEDFFKLAEAIRRNPEGNGAISISEQERRGFIIYIWTYGTGTLGYNKLQLPDPQLGLQSLASRTYNDVKANYISSIVLDAISSKPSEEGAIKWSNFQKNYTGLSNPTINDLLFSYTFPETAVQQNPFNREIVEEYATRVTFFGDKGATKEDLVAGIKELIFSYNTKKFIEKSGGVSRFGQLFLECVASTSYDDNAQRYNSAKYYKRSSAVDERVKGFSLKAEDAFSKVGFNIKAEALQKIIEAEVGYDVWVRPRDEKRYNFSSFICPY
jgi:hypothetical protein